MRKNLLVFGLVLFMTSPANALIIDLPDVDGLGYFKDTNTGYTWLDVDNFSEVLTKDDYMTELFGTGFHLANLSEVLELQQSIPLNPESFNTHFEIMGGVSYFSAGVGSSACIGTSDGQVFCPDPPEPQRAITGYYDDEGGGENLSISTWYATENEWRYRDFNGFIFAGQPSHGAFVVNSLNEPVVPEPSTLLLFGSGLLGAFIRKRYLTVQQNTP